VNETEPSLRRIGNRFSSIAYLAHVALEGEERLAASDATSGRRTGTTHHSSNEDGHPEKKKTETKKTVVGR